MCNLEDQRRSDAEIVEEARELEELLRMPGWTRLKAMADANLETIKESLCRVDPTNVAQIASLQAQARECGYLFRMVQERIRKGREAQKRLEREDERNDGDRRRH